MARGLHSSRDAFSLFLLAGMQTSLYAPVRLSLSHLGGQGGSFSGCPSDLRALMFSELLSAFSDKLSSGSSTFISCFGHAAWRHVRPFLHCFLVIPRWVCICREGVGTVWLWYMRRDYLKRSFSPAHVCCQIVSLSSAYIKCASRLCSVHLSSRMLARGVLLADSPGKLG